MALLCAGRVVCSDIAIFGCLRLNVQLENIFGIRGSSLHVAGTFHTRVLDELCWSSCHGWNTGMVTLNRPQIPYEGKHGFLATEGRIGPANRSDVRPELLRALPVKGAHRQWRKT